MTENLENRKMGWLASLYFIGAYSLAFLFVGLAFADDFVGGFRQANQWMSSQGAIAAAIWSAAVVLFLPGAIVMFVALLWKLRRELEEAAWEWVLAGRQLVRSFLRRPPDDR